MDEFRKYGTDIKLDSMVDNDDYNTRIEAVKQHYGLDKLIKDSNSMVREAIARQGYGLDILIEDEEEYVREEVASRGYGLEILITDESEVVREAVLNYINYHFEIFDDNKLLDIFEKGVDVLLAEFVEQGYGYCSMDDTDSIFELIYEKDCIENDRLNYINSMIPIIKSKNVKNILNLNLHFVCKALLSLVVNDRQKQHILDEDESIKEFFDLI